MTHPIRDFLEIRVAYASSISPDGSKVLVSSNLTGTMQLYRVPSTGGDLIQLTDFAEPVAGGYLPTEDRILMTMDEGGNERTQIYFLDDDGSDLTKVIYEPDYIHKPGGVTRDGSQLAYASNRRNGVDFDVYVRDLVSGDEKLVFDMGGWCQATGFSPDGRFLSVVRLTERNGDNDLFLIDLTTMDRLIIAPHQEPGSVGPPSWLPDSSGFFFASDIDKEFEAIARFDLHAGDWKYVLEDEWDLSCKIDWLGSKLLVTKNQHGFTALEVFDPSTLISLGAVELPHRGLSAGTISKDGRLYAYTFTSPVEPGDVWMYDFESSAHQRLTHSPIAIPPEEFVQPDVESFESFDGEKISALVFKPRKPLKPVPPVVVSVHGGPESQYMPIFSPLLQFLLHRGYAVVAPNVRGSTGYGKRFHHLDDVYKRLDSVKDLASLHGWLDSIGFDQSQAILMGSSYGGYMTLAGLAFQPGLWAAGVCTVGISSLVTFLENTAAWRRKVRETEYGSLETDRDFLIEASPITHIDQMKAPLFLIHGENDPRVPVGEARQIHEVLRGRGIECEMVIYPDEGHGLSKLKNRMDAYPKVADFLDRLFAPN